MIEVSSYKDYDGNIVRKGDKIATVDYDGKTKNYFGEVTKILKSGFYVHPQTDHTNYNEQLWGKFTRKVK